jgi:hypothetical protein
MNKLAKGSRWLRNASIASIAMVAEIRMRSIRGLSSHRHDKGMIPGDLHVPGKGESVPGKHRKFTALCIV